MKGLAPPGAVPFKVLDSGWVDRPVRYERMFDGTGPSAMDLSCPTCPRKKGFEGPRQPL